MMKLIVATTILVMNATAFAVPAITRWVNPDCADGSCEIKGAKLAVEKMMDATGGMLIGGNSIVAELEFAAPEHAKKYAFVQYIKGCLVDQNAKGEQRFASREMFGQESTRFQHKTWEIDSADDADPIYWSSSKAGFDSLRGYDIPRNAGYRNADPNVNANYEIWAGKVGNLLAGNKIYATDVPTQTVLTAKNGKVDGRISSLKFRICVHRISDVPAIADSRTQIIPEPLHCFEWASNFLPDSTGKRLVEAKEFHPFCEADPRD